MGDGRFTSFWHDKWIVDSTLVVFYRRVYALNIHKLSTVRDRVSIGWDLENPRRIPRGGVEQTQ